MRRACTCVRDGPECPLLSVRYRLSSQHHSTTSKYLTIVSATRYVITTQELFRASRVEAAGASLGTRMSIAPGTYWELVYLYVLARHVARVVLTVTTSSGEGI